MYAEFSKGATAAIRPSGTLIAAIQRLAEPNQFAAARPFITSDQVTVPLLSLSTLLKALS